MHQNESRNGLTQNKEIISVTSYLEGKNETVFDEFIRIYKIAVFLKKNSLDRPMVTLQNILHGERVESSHQIVNNTPLHQNGCENLPNIIYGDAHAQLIKSPGSPQILGNRSKWWE